MFIQGGTIRRGVFLTTECGRVELEELEKVILEHYLAGVVATVFPSRTHHFRHVLLLAGPFPSPNHLESLTVHL